MKQKFVNVTLSLVVFLVFSELLSLGWYFLSSRQTHGQGELFYLSDKPPLSIGEAGSEELISDFRLHPYFGFVGKTRFGRNNHGFFFPADYPVEKNGEDEYFIGVFGGSVAENFAIHGRERLIQRLKQEPFFEDKEITVLNFGLGGYKQPQQLLILHYYLVSGQELDLAINIDGFNEVALSNINSNHNVDISMPSASHIAALIGVVDRSTLTGEKVQSLARINRYKSWANRLSATMNDTNLASVYFAQKQLYKILFNQYAREKVNFEQLETDTQESTLYSYAEAGQATAPLFERIASQWAAASMMMDHALKSHNVPYFHFLQPNQYYSQKVFGPGEAFIALTKDHPYRAGVEKGYPVLIDKSEILKQGTVHFYNAVDIFDNEAEAIYQDDCCHYNQRGNEILADFVANSILAAGEF